MWSIILFSFFALTFYSCSTASLNVDYHIPMIRSFSPETIGEKGRFGASSSVHSNHQVSVLRSSQSASIFSSSPSTVVINQDTQSSVSTGLGVQGAYAIIDRLDLFIAKSNESPYELGAQFQFYGEEGMKGKGLKASIWSSLGFQEDNEDESTLSWGDNSKKLDNIEAKTEVFSRSVGILVGHRFDDTWLVFTHLMHQFYEAKSDLKINNGQAVVKEQDNEQWAAVLGFRVNKIETSTFYLQVEGGVSRLRLARGPKDSHRSVAATLGANF